MMSERWYGVGNFIAGGEYNQCAFFMGCLCPRDIDANPFKTRRKFGPSDLGTACDVVLRIKFILAGY